MKKIIGVLKIKKSMGVFHATLFVLFITGCNNNDALLKKQQTQLQELKDKVAVLEDTINKQQKIIDNNNQFSYLHSFTKEELKTYELFAKDKNAQHLSGLSPERIVLIFLHSVVIDDVEAIYSLTYDNGTLPDLDTFRENYYTGGLQKEEINTTLDYRYYTSIKVNEENKTENEVPVEITVSFGLYQSTNIYGLKKDDGIWKLELLHRMEHL